MRIRWDGGRVWDSGLGDFMEASVAFDTETGEIVAVGHPSAIRADEVRSIRGLCVLPGFVDVHVHLRDPGLTHKETLASGLQAAAAGGFTQVACMPNTKPPIARAEIVEDIIRRGEAIGKAEVHPIACLTLDQEGEALADYEALAEAGAMGFSDDGRGVQDGGLMREALAKLAALGKPAMIHAEDESISRGGALHERAAARLGTTAQPGSAEAAMIARDILLAEETGAHLHVCHVSREASAALVQFGKRRGIRVTAEVTPHHLLLSERDIQSADANWKVNPPLASEEDRRACLVAFADGTLDIIATDHAPHHPDEKAKGMDEAPFGMVGLEMAFALLYTGLVCEGLVPMRRLVEAMSERPCRLFGLEGGQIRPGARADLVLVDLGRRWTIDPSTLYTKGRNTPFAGQSVVGKVIETIRAGRVIFREGEERLS
ncbi:dihydroorotase [Alicyclobacillus acidocaldarius]|uniref:Dihydroorotase n=1 Tax=Alicyclobacillus acidocaldarius (strain Tc-4-1) TaxID=1048834 RepID=F8IH90_ALIAT|nr:dihydroorotase [Alicyclobacillus acidocaldarius]AEJ43175.1 dihydroorotase, multifunctional complex type [Alicyclobacillus acidocaldarius subsp. acidocaldarius Tc-4-1]